MIQLFFMAKKKTFFLYSDEDIKCSKCEKVLELAHIVTIHNSYRKDQPYKKSYYCSSKCIKSAITRDQDEFKIAILTSIIPDDCVLVDDTPSATQYGNLSVFQAAAIPSIHTTDKTRYSNTPSLEGAAIGDKEYISHDSKSHKNLSEAEFNKELKDLTKAKPLISEDKKKQIKDESKR